LPSSGGQKGFRGFRNDGKAVVIKPVDQGTDRRVFLILKDRGVVERAHQGTTALKFFAQASEVDIDTEGLCGRIQVGAVDKERDPAFQNYYSQPKRWPLKETAQRGDVAGASDRTAGRLACYVSATEHIWLR
jgi:hypothetical protein